MTYADLAWRNIRRNIHSYAAYVASIAATAAVFYVFMAIFFNPQFVGLANEQVKVLVLFRASAIVIGAFAALFAWYSNSFFLRSRARELATYSLLGMRTSQIVQMVSVESVVIGAGSVSLGVMLGLLLSKLCISLLGRMMLTTVPVSFVLDPKALLATAVMFGMLTLVMTLHTVGIVRRVSIAQLFGAQKQGERRFSAAPWVAGLSVVLIGTGYGLALMQGSRQIVLTALPVLALTVGGTYLLFATAVPAIVGLMRRNRATGYRGNWMLIASQLQYRIRGNAATLATIAVLTAVTLTAAGTSFTFYLASADQAQLTSPFSLAYVSGDTALDVKVEQLIADHPEAGPLLSADSLSMVQVDVQVRRSQTLREVNVLLVGLNDYNKVARHQDTPEEANLGVDEALATGPGLTNAVVTVQGLVGSVPLKVAERQGANILGWGSDTELLVVDDALVAELLRKDAGERVTVRGYMLGHPRNSGELVRAIREIVPEKRGMSSFFDAYSMLSHLTGMVAFIGLFVGIVFIAATGSIISFKQLAEASEERRRYEILKALGIRNGEVRAIVAGQMAVVFGLPLLVGISHSSAALAALQNLLGMSIAAYCLPVVAMFLLFYGLYYLLTVRGYVRRVIQ